MPRTQPKTGIQGDRGAGTLTFDPDVVHLEENLKHPRYDARIERDITDGFIDSFDPDLGGRQEEPAVVVKQADGTPEVVNGRRRLRALRTLNKRRRAEGKSIVMFWAVYRRMKNPDDHAEFRAIREVSNLHEGDPASMKAERAMRFIEEDKWPKDKVAPLFGWDLRQLDRYLALAECVAVVRSAVDGGRLPLVAAEKIARLSRSEQPAELDRVLGAKTSATTAPKKRNGTTASGRPTTKTVRAVAEYAEPIPAGSLAAGFVAGARWAAGQMTRTAAVKLAPELAGVIPEAK